MAGPEEPEHVRENGRRVGGAYGDSMGSLSRCAVFSFGALLLAGGACSSSPQRGDGTSASSTGGTSSVSHDAGADSTTALETAVKACEPVPADQKPACLCAAYESRHATPPVVLASVCAPTSAGCCPGTQVCLKSASGIQCV